MQTFLEFEKPIAHLESKIEELRHVSKTGDVAKTSEIIALEEKTYKLLNQIYKNLTPWQKVQVARHPERPKFLDYLNTLFEEYVPLSGDRLFADDNALLGGLATFEGQSVVVMGHQKGHDTESRIKHNFGMARPEGYRKAQRLMKMADQFNLPIISFVDTAGAYPGIDAEERGQAEAIAKSIEVSLSLKVPFISIIIGEGGSGGAIAIATANIVMMLENAIYSVISPEGCASILWRSREKAQDVAGSLKITAHDLKNFGVIDAIIPEPIGGAHRFKEEALANTKDAIRASLKTFQSLSPEQIKKQRYEKFLNIGRKGF
ncbi:MAG: acetyl-CoA carboxylase carboxyltransferase subunit alpha [Proteobacteria bacterium]|nr:acetyl-CoA carboxylase carboxyltransferase subunit alpha [Pseudomonadota bacterium]